jgi:geranylgeranyl diphosphate synthase type II
MMIHLFEHASGAERRRLTEMLSSARNERGAEDVRWVRELMDRHGSIGYARQAAHGLAGAARYECTRLFGALPDSPDKRFIEALPEWVIRRT